MGRRRSVAVSLIASTVVPHAWSQNEVASSSSSEPVEAPKKKKTLADDPSFKRPVQHKLMSDPACNEHPRWSKFQKEVMASEWPDNKVVAARVFFDRNFQEVKNMDDEAIECFMGTVTTLFLLSKYRMTKPRQLDAAMYLFRMLDNYMGTVHPNKFDEYSDHGKRWPITDFEYGQLRREVFIKSAAWPQNAFEQMKLADGEPHPYRIYVYDPADFGEMRTLTMGAQFCKDNQWGFEVLIHDWFLASQHRTDDPAEADFFFVPQYTSCSINTDSLNETSSTALFESLIPKLPYFRRSGGRDHVFVWGAGFSVHLFIFEKIQYGHGIYYFKFHKLKSVCHRFRQNS